MTKINLSFLITFFAYTLVAQPIITNSITPEIGDTWDITFMEISSFDPGLGGGVAQTWDFSNLDISNAIDLEIQVLDPTMIADGPTYPDADFVWYLPGFEIYNYYAVTDDSISLVGGASIQNGSIDFQTDFIDPEDGLHLPVEHGDSYTYYSFFNQTVFGTSLGTNERNGIVTADGYGTLITPSGTYSDILRLVITETSFGFTNTQYAWYDVNNFVPVFLYEESDDPEAPPSLYFSTPETGTTNSKDLSLVIPTWNAWYDSNDRSLTVDLPDLSTVSTSSIQIYTLDGKVLKSEKLSPLDGQTNYKIKLPETLVCNMIIVSLRLDGRLDSKKVSVGKH